MKNRKIRAALNTVTPTYDRRARMRAALAAQLPEETKVRPRYEGRMETPKRFAWVPGAIALIAALALCGFVLKNRIMENRAMAPVKVTEEIQEWAFQSSDLYRASLEWNAYVDGLDIGNDNVFGGVQEPYSAYGCEDAEMMAKLDEICETYGLELPGNSVTVRDFAEFLKILCVDSIFVQRDGVKQTVPECGTYYPDGSFSFGGTVTMSGEESGWGYPISYSFHHMRSTTFFDEVLEIGDLSEYGAIPDADVYAFQEGQCFAWDYLTDSGTEVLLVLKQDAAFVIVPGEHAVDLVKVENPRVGDAVLGEQIIGKEALEAFAETFDFSLPPDGGLAPIPDPKVTAKVELNVYRSPSDSSNVTGTIPEGTEITLEKREWFMSEEWGFLNGEAGYGWIRMADVELTYYDPKQGSLEEFLAEPEETEPESHDYVAIAATDLAVYGAPNATKSIVALIDEGTQLVVVRQETIMDVRWGYTESGKEAGWILMDGVVLVDRTELEQVREILEQMRESDEKSGILDAIEKLKAAETEGS